MKYKMDAKLREFIIKFGNDKNFNIQFTEKNSDEYIIDNCDYIICFYEDDIPDLDILPNLKYVSISKSKISKLPKLPDSVHEILIQDTDINYLPELPPDLKNLTFEGRLDYVMNEPRFFGLLSYVSPYIIENVNNLYINSFYHRVKEIIDYKNSIKSNNITPSRYKDYYESLKKMRRLLRFMEDRGKLDIILNSDYKSIIKGIENV